MNKIYVLVKTRITVSRSQKFLSTAILVGLVITFARPRPTLKRTCLASLPSLPGALIFSSFLLSLPNKCLSSWGTRAGTTTSGASGDTVPSQTRRRKYLSSFRSVMKNGVIYGSPFNSDSLDVHQYVISVDEINTSRPSKYFMAKKRNYYSVEFLSLTLPYTLSFLQDCTYAFNFNYF